MIFAVNWRRTTVVKRWSSLSQLLKVFHLPLLLFIVAMSRRRGGSALPILPSKVGSSPDALARACHVFVEQAAAAQFTYLCRKCSMWWWLGGLSSSSYSPTFAFP